MNRSTPCTGHQSHYKHWSLTHSGRVGGSAGKASNQPNVCVCLWTKDGNRRAQRKRTQARGKVTNSTETPPHTHTPILYLSLLKKILILHLNLFKTFFRLLSAVKVDQWMMWMTCHLEWKGLVWLYLPVNALGSFIFHPFSYIWHVFDTFALLPEGFWGFCLSLILPCHTCTFWEIAFPMVHLFFVWGANHTLFPW